VRHGIRMVWPMTRTFQTRVQQVLRGGAVGAVATLGDAATLAVLTEAHLLAPQIAIVPAMALGVLIQFVGNKYLTFQDRSHRRIAAQSLQFAIVELLSMGLGLLLYQQVLRTGLHYLLARSLVGALIYFGVSLPLWGRIFRQRSGERTAS
jgi:putative flippase GtrA